MLQFLQIIKAMVSTGLVYVPSEGAQWEEL